MGSSCNNIRKYCTFYIFNFHNVIYSFGKKEKENSGDLSNKNSPSTLTAQIK